MALRHRGPISHVVARCLEIGHVKRHEKDIESFMQKREYLFDIRDSIKEEIIREYMWMTKQTKESRKRLNKDGEIESHFNDVSESHKEGLDNLMVHQPNRAKNTMTSPSIEGSFGSIEKSKNVNLEIKAETNDEPKVKAGFSRAQGKEAAQREEILFKTPTVSPIIDSAPVSEDELSHMDETEIKIPDQTEEGLSLLEPRVDAGRSIERTVSRILGCMSDAAAGRIGVYGIGGIGKTTVLKALVSHPKVISMFDKIIRVTVSRYWSTRKIQNEVLNHLSLCPAGFKTDSEIAEKLFQVLSSTKVLLLLDDVWEQIDLEAVGIPHPSSENGCRIVLASRKLDVCRDMDVIREIKVEPISGKEAWELFYKQVGEIIDLPNIQPYAKKIVKACGGVPLLIIVTGSAMTEMNDVFKWEHVSREFALPCADGKYCIEDVIQLLKFSFDQLKAQDIKNCFLYCALFSEDQEVNILKFVEHCIQEGLIAGGLVNAPRRGNDIVDALVRSSLLQSTEGGHAIKMHDVIRDLALGILSSEAEGCQFLLRAYSRLTEPSNKGCSSSSGSGESRENNRLFIPEGHQFSLRAGAGLMEPPLDEEWEQAKMIFWMGNELSTLPDSPSCPKLLSLFLQRNYRLRTIPKSFFDSMPSLKVLNLSKTRIKFLPQTLSKLRKLQFLILRDCERLFMLPSEVGSLSHLEVLDLQGTWIHKLPDEIGYLASLKHLEVFFYGSINQSEYVKLPHGLISGGIISRLCALETLSVIVYPGDWRWNENVKFVTVEVGKLTKLTSLSFCFPEVKLLELFLQTSTAWNGQHLTAFKFVVGNDVKRIVSRIPHYVEFGYGQQGQCLRFVNGENIPEAVVKVLTHSTAFHLDHYLDICTLSDFGVYNIEGLKFCIVSECLKIEKIVGNIKLTTAIFPCLEHLSIHFLWNLTCMWEGSLPKGSFVGLRILSVYACPKLKYLFSSSMLQYVSNLEELVVEDCQAIEEIISKDEIIKSGTIPILNLKVLTLHFLPGLVSICKSEWPFGEHISISIYDCPNLKRIGINSKLISTIREIKAEKDWWDALEWEETALRRHLEDRFSPISDDDV